VQTNALADLVVLVSSGEIVREHSRHVAVCCSAIGASPMQKRERMGLPPGGTTPAHVTPDAPVVGERERSALSPRCSIPSLEPRRRYICGEVLARPILWGELG
jgi:hypothetical protein